MVTLQVREPNLPENMPVKVPDLKLGELYVQLVRHDGTRAMVLVSPEEKMREIERRRPKRGSCEQFDDAVNGLAAQDALPL